MKYLAIASVASLALLAACNQGGDSAAQNTGEAVNATQDATSGVVGQTSAMTMGANTVDGFVTGLGTGHKPGPAARSVMGGRQGCGLPAVEVPHHRHRACVGCPNPKIHTPLPRLLREMGAKFVKLPVVRGKRAGH